MVTVELFDDLMYWPHTDHLPTEPCIFPRTCACERNFFAGGSFNAASNTSLASWSCTNAAAVPPIPRSGCRCNDRRRNAELTSAPVLNIPLDSNMSMACFSDNMMFNVNMREISLTLNKTTSRIIQIANTYLVHSLYEHACTRAHVHKHTLADVHTCRCTHMHMYTQQIMFPAHVYNVTIHTHQPLPGHALFDQNYNNKW